MLACQPIGWVFVSGISNDTGVQPGLQISPEEQSCGPAHTEALTEQ